MTTYVYSVIFYRFKAYPPGEFKIKMVMSILERSARKIKLTAAPSNNKSSEGYEC